MNLSNILGFIGDHAYRASALARTLPYSDETKHEYAMTFTYPGFNSKKGRTTRTPDYWAAICYGRSGIGATPLEALANAAENAVRWYCTDWEDPDQMILAALETGHA